MTEERQAPYPADTRSKGWRFELDLERIRQSDTWALATPEVRPWLFLLWATSWEQVPCGSLPADDALIAARIGMAPKAFAKARAVLMRGWWPAADGRLYHDTIADRVRAMLDSKTKEAKRKAEYRAKMDAERAALAAGQDKPGASVPRDNHGTDARQTRDSRGSDPGRDATGTGTGTGTGLREEKETRTERVRAGEPEPPDLAAESPTAAGLVCRAMKAEGIADPNPGHPDLLALLEAGTTDVEFVGAARAAVKREKGFAYALGTLKRQRIEAAQTAAAMARGPLAAGKHAGFAAKDYSEGIAADGTIL